MYMYRRRYGSVVDFHVCYNTIVYFHLTSVETREA